MVLLGHTHSIIPEWEARNAAIQPIFDNYLPHYARSADGAHLVRDWTVANVNMHSLWYPARLLYGKMVDDTYVEDAESRVIDYVLGWRNTVAMYQAVFDYDLADAYRRIQAPTLVLELLTAQEMHYGEQAARIAALMPQGRSAVIPGSYLAAPQEQPGEIAAIALPFLRGQATR